MVSPDGMYGALAPSRMVAVSASVNLPLHHKVQKFSLPNTPSDAMLLLSLIHI